MSATESPAEILERLHRERQQQAQRETRPSPAPVQRARTPSREQLNAFWEVLKLRNSIERDHLDIGLWTDP